MIRFLKALLALLKEFIGKSDTSGDVRATERISRFILSRSHYSAENQRVKYGAFMPSPSKQVSVYRTSSIDESTIWQIGSRHVAEPMGKKLYARGDVGALVIFDKRLNVVAAPSPHKLHANIMGWPSGKDEQKMLAVELANAAALRTTPNETLGAQT